MSAEWFKRWGDALLPWMVGLLIPIVIPVVVAVYSGRIQASIAQQSQATQASIAQQSEATQAAIAAASEKKDLAIAEQSNRREYVQIAVGILSARLRSKNDSLQSWAVAVLQENTPVPISESERKRLKALHAFLQSNGHSPQSVFYPDILLEPATQSPEHSPLGKHFAPGDFKK